MHQVTRVFAAGLLALAALAAPQLAPAAHAQAPEKTDLKLAVGGKPLFYYLPLTIAERLGYFKAAGLNVEISDFGGGAKALQALLGGSADVTTGAFDHTIQMQAKQQTITAVIELGRYPGIALGLVKGKLLNYQSPKDLKGAKIGVTAPGSSTNFMASYLMAKAGLKPDDAAFIGVGSGASVVAAVKRGEIDAIAHLDPTLTQLERSGDLRIVEDTRTEAGSRAVYGGDYPAAVLYVTKDFLTTKPGTTQALVTAMLKSLKWLETATPEQVADTVPPEYVAGDRELYIDAFKHSRAMFSLDGKFNEAGAKNAYAVLSAFDPAVQSAKIDLAETFTNKFVQAATATLK